MFDTILSVFGLVRKSSLQQTVRELNLAQADISLFRFHSCEHSSSGDFIVPVERVLDRLETVKKSLR